MKISIELEYYTLQRAKCTYRTHFAMKADEKVTKADLASWFGDLVQGDLDSVHGDESELDED